MIELEYEMTYAETIVGPLPPTSGSPTGERLCWEVRTATGTPTAFEDQYEIYRVG